MFWQFFQFSIRTFSKWIVNVYPKNTRSPNPIMYLAQWKQKALKATELKLVVDSNLVGISKMEVGCSLLGRKNGKAHLSFVFLSFVFSCGCFWPFSSKCFFSLEVGREDLCADCKTSNDLVNHEMNVTKKKKYIYIYIYNKSRYEQCFEFCSVLVGTDEKYCIGIQTKITLHWIKFCPIPSCFGCTFWAFLFPLKVKPLP